MADPAGERRGDGDLARQDKFAPFTGAMRAQIPHDTFALPIPTTQLAQGLIRLYQRLAGELEKRKTGEAQLLTRDDAQAGMHHIRALLKLLRVDFDPRRIKPRRSRVQIGPLDHGGVRRGILRALKVANRWMTYAEIVDALIVAHDLVLPPDARRHFQQKIREACSILKQGGLIEPELELGPGKEPRRQRWRIAKRLRGSSQAA